MNHWRHNKVYTDEQKKVNDESVWLHKQQQHTLTFRVKEMCRKPATAETDNKITTTTETLHRCADVENKFTKTQKEMMQRKVGLFS